MATKHGAELRDLPISRQQAEFLLFNDLLNDNAYIACKGVDGTKGYMPLSYENTMDEETGRPEFEDSWHDFEIWML
jgi:hypothetical protein